MTTPASTMTYTVSASTRAGGAASVRARTSDIAFDGSAQSGGTLPGPPTCSAACEPTGEIEAVSSGGAT